MRCKKRNVAGAPQFRQLPCELRALDRVEPSQLFTGHDESTALVRR